MQREDVLAVLKAHEADLRARGVARVALFGSLARGEARPNSDVDLMVEIDPPATSTYTTMSGIIHSLQDLFYVSMDVASREG